ncbi:nuclear transport factor 2 family protein [Lusitaniella coriacea LEGE 07157]|uniref:Nuclear transport factor 2 family protein n=1 Tax=Lusitaniella coriacea LEGE 07157 TaxID=945747 RepID=A0A8J7JAZ7_9CYAN|nr:nuclear transport factor 2 family protein [Lusitaniella coriacea]MBE9116580.1 nuclear transport factor 2 family protein [Lusitaniella coriacea LEGE 07157]
MPFHDITELPSGFCDPNTVTSEKLSVEDRVQITELLHRIYLCEDSRDYDALEKILVSDYINEHPLFGKHESASSFIDWFKNTPAGFDGIRHNCLNSITHGIRENVAESVSYILVLQLFPAKSRNESPTEKLDSLLPRIIGHGVVRDRWIRQEDRWYLKHRVYQQMSINAAFLPDKAMREKAAQNP